MSVDCLWVVTLMSSEDSSFSPGRGVLGYLFRMKLMPEKRKSVVLSRDPRSESDCSSKGEGPLVG